MRVEDFYGVGSEITDADALEAALMQTHGEKVNEFWLSHGDQCYPGISLLVKGDFAALHYFPRETPRLQVGGQRGWTAPRRHDHVLDKC